MQEQNIERGDSSGIRVDLSASLGELPLSALQSTGLEEEEQQSRSLTLKTHSAADMKKGEWAKVGDYELICIKHGESIHGLDNFNQLMGQLLSPLDQEGKTYTKIQVQMMENIMSGKLLAGYLYDLPMICTGSKCLMSHTCAFKATATPYPLGESCPIEKAQISRWVQDYLEEVGLSEINPSDRAFVRELVSIHITQSRIGASLARRPDPIMEVAIGFDGDNNQVMQEKENPLIKESIALAKSMERMMQKLHVTREQQKKTVGDLDTLSTMYDKLNKKASEISNRFGIVMDDLNIHGEKSVEVLVRRDGDGQTTKTMSFADKVKSMKISDQEATDNKREQGQLKFKKAAADKADVKQQGGQDANTNNKETNQENSNQVQI